MKLYCACKLCPDVLVDPPLPEDPTQPIKPWTMDSLKVHVRYPMELLKKNQPRYIKNGMVKGMALDAWGAHYRTYPNCDIWRCQYCGHVIVTDTQNGEADPLPPEPEDFK
jgi:hypothetical protein